MKWIIKEKKTGTPTRTIAEIENVTRRRINQICRKHKDSKENPKLGRPKKNYLKKK